MDWIKQKWRAFNALPSKKKIEYVGAGVVIFVMLIWLGSKLGSKSSTTDESQLGSSKDDDSSIPSTTINNGGGTNTTPTNPTSPVVVPNTPTVTSSPSTNDSDNSSSWLNKLSGLSSILGSSRNTIASPFGTGISGSSSSPFDLSYSAGNAFQSSMGYTQNSQAISAINALSNTNPLTAGINQIGNLLGFNLGRNLAPKTYNYDSINAGLGIGKQTGVFAQNFGGLPVGITEEQAQASFDRANQFDQTFGYNTNPSQQVSVETPTVDSNISYAGTHSGGWSRSNGSRVGGTTTGAYDASSGGLSSYGGFGGGGNNSSTSATSSSFGGRSGGYSGGYDASKGGLSGYGGFGGSSNSSEDDD